MSLLLTFVTGDARKIDDSLRTGTRKAAAEISTVHTDWRDLVGAWARTENTPPLKWMRSFPGPPTWAPAPRVGAPMANNMGNGAREDLPQLPVCSRMWNYITLLMH